MANAVPDPKQADAGGRPPGLARWARHWEWWLVGLAALGAFLLYRDYGTSWDAAGNALYGDDVLDYFLSGFKSRQSTLVTGNMAAYYGTLFDLPSAALHRVLGLNNLTLRGLLSALWAVATLPAIIRIGRRFGGERVAFFAAAALMLTPAFFGHAFINQKDIPLACAVSWAVLAICNFVTGDESGWRRILMLAVTFGIALGVRVGAAFLFVFLAAALAARVGQSAMSGAGRPQAVAKAGWGRMVVRIGAGLLIVWSIMVVAWPYAHRNLLLNPYRAFRAAMSFPGVYPVLFQGQTVPSDQLPATYLAEYFILGLPPALLALIAGGVIAAFVALVRHWREREALPLFVVLFWIGFPLVYVAVVRPNIYDGSRHFLFVVPALALMAARGAETLAQGIENRWGWVAAWAAPLVVLSTAVPALIRWHPYEYAYLNGLAGDRATLHTRFETDYWVTSYKAAAEWLNQRQRESARPLQVLVAANPQSFPALVHYLDPRIQPAGMLAESGAKPLPAEFDYYVGTVRYGMDRNFPASPVVWEERRDGVLLCVIRAAAR